jgi:hypothetical protein
MGTTDLYLPGAVQIGNIIAHQALDSDAYRANIAAAFVKAYADQEMKIFIIVAQHDEEAIRIVERSGFTRERPMYRMHCVLKENF